MHTQSTPARCPFADLMVFVSAKIVSDNVNMLAGIFTIQAFQERQELLVGVFVNATGRYYSGVHS